MGQFESFPHEYDALRDLAAFLGSFYSSLLVSLITSYAQISA